MRVLQGQGVLIMGYLIDAIREQKLLDADVAINDFIEENNISEESFIFELELSKDRFETEQEALEYVKNKWYSPSEIMDSDGAWLITITNKSQLDLDTMIEIELARGVTARAADFRPEVNECFTFNEKAEIFQPKLMPTGAVELTEGVPYIIELCKVIEGEHANYGKIKITKEDLKSMERNFIDNVTGIDLAINEDHKKENAFGWIKDVFLSRDEGTLYGQIVWNSKGISTLSEKEYRYLSPEFKFSYTHPHSGKSYGPTLLGAALTNYPFLKMGAIVELNSKQLNSEAEMGDTISLKEHEKTMLELNTKLVDVEKQLNKTSEVIKNLKEENQILKVESEKIKLAAEKAEKEAKHEKLFTEGKINKAQLVALNEGKDLLEVLSLTEKVNPESKGGSNTADTIELSEEDKLMAKRMDLTEEEYKKYGMSDEE